ncbi:MAG: hypothetical protein QM760_17955 [Nibricoccus sp.]
MSFLKFFKSSVANDGLSQSEREAIADLLHFGMYADNHLSLVEDKVISDAVFQMGWDAKVSFESFQAQSLARVREAKENPEARAAFYKSLQDRLASKATRARALNLVTKLFQSDGTSDKESAVLAEIKRLLA